MSGGSSNKPIVFVFGTNKGDAAGRKKNLSAINTQVAYRAHERRREKKNRQRAQAKDDGKADQSGSSASSVPTSAPITLDNIVAHDGHATTAIQPRQARSFPPIPPRNSDISQAPLPFVGFAETSEVPVTFVNVSAEDRRPIHDRRESNASSLPSSEQDGIWSASPTSLRQSTPATDLSSLSPTSCPPGPISGYFDKALDPFFRLPQVATEREKWLVHFYFREMGHIGFGTHNNALFCPDRDWVSSYVSSRSLCFQWVLILAEEQLGRMGILPDQTQTIERKAKAYGHLNSILRSKSVSRDEGISGIMYAAIVDSQRTSMHLMALDRFINESGGFEAFLDGPLGIAHPEHVATVYAFGRCPIPNLRDLEGIRDQFLNILRDLHAKAKVEQEEKRRIRNRRPWDALSRQVTDSNGTLVPATHDEHFRYFVKAQQDCFSSEVISPLLNSILDPNTDWSSQARHLATLIQTSLILHEFEDNYLARAMFLKRLKYVAEMSTARDMRNGMPHLSHAGLLLINSFVRQEVQTYFERAKVLPKAVKISKIVVDSLKIFGLLQQQTRSMIVSWLRDWLCFNEQHFENEQVARLNENDLMAISAEIHATWMNSVRKGSG